jgi:tetratricopeptide (TPR) repeat protein
MGLFRKKKPADGKPASPPALATPASAPAPAPAAATPAAPPPTATAGPAKVTVRDAFGRPHELPREQWRKDVLPKLVEQCARDPQRLAALVLQGLRDGLAADVLPAALRLPVVDQDAERSLAILAAVQRECGELEGCAATLRELAEKKPQSAALRVGQALLRDRAGARVEALALLWEALQIDSNHADALHGWLAFEHARTGDAGHGEALDRVCGLPGAWRARLLRAHRAFEQSRVDDGLADLREALAGAGDDSDALTLAASDLLRAGRHDQFAELVLPRYRLERHHPNVGVLLLQHFAATRQPALGEQLLHELRVRFPRVLDGQLAPLDAEFARMAPPPALPQGETKVVLYRIDRPLWFASLGDPEWLLPAKPAGSRRVLCAALAVQSPAALPAMQREDELGRLSRAVPLFLAEQFWLLSPVRGGAAIPVAEQGGWVVSGVPWAEERLVALLSDAERDDTLLVSGVVRPDGKRRRIDLWVYDCKARQRLGHAAAEGDEGALGPLLLQLLAELSPIVGGPPALRPPVGGDAFCERHATGLAQLAALVIAQLGGLPKDRVYGQRAIFEWLLGVALEQPGFVPAKLAFAAALCADAALGSHVHRELAQPLAELFRVEPPQSAFAKVAVKPLKLLGLEQFWAQRRAAIVAGADQGYLAWLQKVETAR